MTVLRTVVVAAHGTRDPAGVAVAGQLTDALRIRLPGGSVLLAFVDVLGPAVRDVVAAVPGPVTVVPAFLACGYHVRTDVPREVAATGRRDVTVTAALGPHRLLVGAMADRLRAAGWRRGDAVVLAAAGSSDQRAVADVRAAAVQLSGQLSCRVRIGFVATGNPSVTALVRGLRAGGAPRVAVASWLLAPGLFHRRLASTGADVVAAPLGAHPAVIDRLASLARESTTDGKPVLAELAAEHGTTIGGHVGELTSAQRTRAEWERVAQQTRAYLGEHFGCDPTPQVRAALEAEHAAIMSDLAVQFAARRGTRRASA